MEFKKIPKGLRFQIFGHYEAVQNSHFFIFFLGKIFMSQKGFTSFLVGALVENTDHSTGFFKDHRSDIFHKAYKLECIPDIAFLGEFSKV